MNNFIKIFIVLMAMLFVAEASHFRFGSISWQPQTAPNIIKFTSNFAFRTTFFKSSKTAITLGEQINVGSLTYGTGSGIAATSVILTVTDFDPVNDWFSGSYTVTKTYPLPAAGTVKTYVPIFTSCCRISTLINNKDGSWNVTTLVQIENNSLDKINSSPVSGMLPIYNVVYGKNNNFNILASDPNNDTLTFSFSTVYPMTQPTGMTIDSKGAVYFKPTQTGLYSTQIYIVDTKGAYVVVDFILNSISEPGICHSSCTNKGATCTTNSQCANCDPTLVASTVNDTCTVPSKYPPIFVDPTPADGTSITINVKQSKDFTIKCQSGSTAKVYVQTANVPAPITQTKQFDTNHLNEWIKYSWTPGVSDVGSYVMSAYCYDDNALTSTVRSFSILVPKPKCGQGDEVNGVCVCPDGWDPKSNCFDCTKYHYGPKCSNSTVCVNGESNDGINNDGTCSCYNGWSGETCSIPVSKTCSGLTNSIIASTITTESYINPTFMSLYVKDKTTLSVRYSIKSPLPILNVYVLVDVNAPSSTVWNYIKSNMNSFQSSFNKFSESTQYGIGFFNDEPTTGFNFQPSLTIGSPLDISSYSPVSYVSTSNGNSLLAITEAASSPLGWSSNAFKTIVLITDSDHKASASDIANFQATLTKQSIMPIIVGHNGAVLTNWKSTIASTGFGFVNESVAGSEWVNKASGSFFNSIQSIIFKPVEDVGEDVITSVPAAVKVNPYNLTDGTVSGIDITIPASTEGLVSSPTPRVSAIGYGAIDLRVNYNRKPTGTSFGFTCNQNSKATFQLSGTDPDSNILTFSFVTLPANGTITDSSNKPVTVGTQYASTTIFTFSTLNKAVTIVSPFLFRANDGCVDSANATISVTITKVNQVPDCVGGVVLNSKGKGAAQNLKFTLTGTDVEDPTSKLYTNFGSFPNVSPTYGYFTIPSSQYNVNATTQIPVGTEITFVQTNNVASDMSVSFYYIVYDSSNAYSSGCTITLNLIHTNVAPIATGTTPVSVIPLGVARLNLTATDIDSNSVTFKITALAPGIGGSFYDCASNNPINVNMVTQSITVDKTTRTASLIGSICYKAPEDYGSSGTSFGSISYTATDFEGLVSENTFTTKIDIVGVRENWAPVVTKIPDFSVYQESTYKSKENGPFYVNGTDQDESDKKNLMAVISKAPAHGVLLSATGSTVVNGKAPLAIYYQPTLDFVGTDSFSYYVYDTFNNASSIETTTVTINRVNHAPVIKKEVTFVGNSGMSATNPISWSVTDPEGDDITCVITEAPNNVELYDYPTNAKYVLNSNLTKFNTVNFNVDPSKTSPKYTSFTSYFTVVCNDYPPQYKYPSFLKDTNRFTYLYTYINTQPETTSFNRTLNQDDQISWTFNGTDLETATSSLKVSILALPTNGKLLFNSVEVTDTTKLYSLSGFSYKPNKGMSDYETNYLPLDKFTFTVVDAQGLASSISTGIFSVTPRNPPIYTGLRVINVYQNTRYPLTITGVPGNGGIEVNLNVISFSANQGSVLSASYIMGAEKPIDVPIASYPFTLVGSTTYYLAYMPPKNKYGDNFDTITIQLYDRDILSGLITIIVNVIHVNQPPVITPISYVTSDNTSIENFFANDDYTVNMNVDTSATIKFDGSDVDNPVIPLQAILPSLPVRGTVKTLGGDIISGINQNITQHTDGHYYLVFEPAPGAAFARYATIPVVMKDEFGLYSDAAKVVVNVNRQNEPPFVTIEDKYQAYTFNVKDIINPQSINATDLDTRETSNKILLSVSIIYSKNESVVLRSVATFNISGTPNSCNFDKNFTIANCTDTVKNLEQFATKLSVTGFVAGDYRLKIHINDLGFNAPKEIRSSSILTATNYVNLTIKNPGTTTTKSNKTILSVAIAAAGAAAAIIAAGLWKLLKKSAPPTDAFFGDSPFADGGVSTNPMYEQSNNMGTNPLYESGNDC